MNDKNKDNNVLNHIKKHRGKYICSGLICTALIVGILVNGTTNKQPERAKIDSIVKTESSNKKETSGDIWFEDKSSEKVTNNAKSEKKAPTDLAEKVFDNYNLTKPKEIKLETNLKNNDQLLLAKTESVSLDLKKEKELVQQANKPSVVEVEPPKVIEKPTDNNSGNNSGTEEPEIPPVIVSTPVIETSSDYEIVLQKGDYFDLTNYYLVRDAADATPLVRTQGSVDMMRVGPQQVTISVINRFGNTAVKTLSFYVNEKATFKTVKEPSLMQDEPNFNPLDYVTASHHKDGDVSANIEIIKNEVDVTKAGKYLVEYKVVDSKQTAAFYKLEFEVSNEAPVIVNAKDLTYELGTTITKEMLLDGVSATDREDDKLGRPLEVNLSESDFKQINSTVEGTYSLTYLVKDSHGKTAQKQISVIIVKTEESEGETEETPKEPTEEESQGSIVTSNIEVQQPVRRSNATITSRVEPRKDDFKPYE